MSHETNVPPASDTTFTFENFATYVVKQKLTGDFRTDLSGIKFTGILSRLQFLGNLFFFSRTILQARTNSSRSDRTSNAEARIYALHITPFFAIGFVNPQAKKAKSPTDPIE